MIISCAAVQVFFRLVYDPGFNWVVMNIVQFLNGEFGAIAFLWLIILSPKLVMLIASICGSKFFKYSKHPFLAAFMNVFTGRFYDLVRSELLQISMLNRSNKISYNSLDNTYLLWIKLFSGSGYEIWKLIGILAAVIWLKATLDLFTIYPFLYILSGKEKLHATIWLWIALSFNGKTRDK